MNFMFYFTDICAPEENESVKNRLEKSLQNSNSGASFQNAVLPEIPRTILDHRNYGNTNS